MSIQQSAIEAALASARSLAGVTATYERSGTGSVTLTVIPGNTRVETVDEHGSAVHTKVRDFVIERNKIKLAGSQVAPAAGDAIKTTRPDGTVDTWQIAPIGGDRHARPHDPGNTHVRVHTHLIDSQ